MTSDESNMLLRETRLVLERYLFDGPDLRDDIAEVCAKIDDALTPAAEAAQPKRLEVSRERHRLLELSADRLQAPPIACNHNVLESTPNTTSLSAQMDARTRNTDR